MNVYCPICDCRCPNNSQLTVHINSNHQDADIVGYIRCLRCGKLCRGKKGVSQHRCSRSGSQSEDLDSNGQEEHLEAEQREQGDMADIEDAPTYTDEQIHKVVAHFLLSDRYLHTSWRKPILEICIKSWNIAAAGANRDTATMSFAGFLILPGIVRFVRQHQGTCGCG